ncbi:AraC family transcriptional regulator [Halarcobacter anaerophilus]|jgi:AraC family transcriptional regulator|uniref:AraC family transcriptional regulator n=1 Tax=Halarcobacter anaerophilus TaxID=877500 RepID=A0A4Q0Y3G6_9BACT|nr:AraC family transcriptional regulator [Halarcobacter anaerophilus]QDF29433.1 transcriptional regulator, AraC family (GyrI domain) [Halarcobacter anaerophilus]RXJ64677.1 AraC family transcriptional regulator [Halarcobacter anaerophilus]
MKKDTKHARDDIINTTFYYIYKNLEYKITLDELAKLNHLSKYHYHRIIKEETGKTLFELIADERLKKAANLLITNKHSTISEIANKCGYISHSSFIKAFKLRYNYTPTQWRKGKFKEYSKELIEKFLTAKDFSKIEPEIKVCKVIHCAYIRHNGYDKTIKKSWEKLKAIAYENGIKEYKQIALFHDNPVITPLKNCSYVACINVNKDFKAISTFDIPESLCAVFNLKGVYGDVLNFIRYVYHYWLPNSGYEAKTIPAYAIYHKNYFTTEQKDFDLDFYLPINVLY